MQLFDTEIDLGPSVRWIAKARLETPLDELRAAVEGDPPQSVETRWTPVDGSPVHVFFRDWPKSSLKEVQDRIKEFEQHYEMSSRTFQRAWQREQGKARRIDDGDLWMSLIGVREELKSESSG